PEFANVTSIIARNSSSKAAKARNKVRVVFGTFNKRAGRWANKPISSFPVDLSKIFDELKESRKIGNFAGTVNNFIASVNRYMDDPSLFHLERGTGGGANDIANPDLKYRFFEDPSNPNQWVVYFYDNKNRQVKLSEALGTFNQYDETQTNNFISK